MILSNGAAPLLSYINHDPGPGSRDKVGLVLAAWHGQYVVWSIMKDDDEDAWQCESGDYFGLQEQAEYMFGVRLRRYYIGGRSRRGFLEEAI